MHHKKPNLIPTWLTEPHPTLIHLNAHIWTNILYSTTLSLAKTSVSLFAHSLLFWKVKCNCWPLNMQKSQAFMLYQVMSTLSKYSCPVQSRPLSHWLAVKESSTLSPICFLLDSLFTPNQAGWSSIYYRSVMSGLEKDTTWQPSWYLIIFASFSEFSSGANNNELQVKGLASCISRCLEFYCQRRLKRCYVLPFLCSFPFSKKWKLLMYSLSSLM